MERRKLLEKGGKPLQLCLRECAINVLKGNVPLTKSQLKKLGKHKKKIRDLSQKKTSYKRRIAIEQKGGFLPLLLAPITPVAGGWFHKRSVVSKCCIPLCSDPLQEHRLGGHLSKFWCEKVPVAQFPW